MENFAKYTRQISLDGFGEDGQRKLAASKVALIGVGGVGSAALPLLAGAGFGEIALADFDRVSEHNLHRQTIYRADSSGRPKAELAARYASALNPDVRVKFFDGKLTDENADEILGGALLCIDADMRAAWARPDCGDCGGVRFAEFSLRRRILFRRGCGHFGFVEPAARTADISARRTPKRGMGGVGGNKARSLRRIRNGQVFDVRRKTHEILFRKYQMICNHRVVG